LPTCTYKTHISHGNKRGKLNLLFPFQALPHGIAETSSSRQRSAPPPNPLSVRAFRIIHGGGSRDRHFVNGVRQETPGYMLRHPRDSGGMAILADKMRCVLKNKGHVVAGGFQVLRQFTTSIKTQECSFHGISMPAVFTGALNEHWYLWYICVAVTKSLRKARLINPYTWNTKSLVCRGHVLACLVAFVSGGRAPRDKGVLSHDYISYPMNKERAHGTVPLICQLVTRVRLKVRSDLRGLGVSIN
jgi:hypothetical protein